ncbi:hypothetical protein AB0950_35225 [Streptomyces sp. NPDC007189]|uniref:hypothetical protein n=1 Tax=Streptomyces sp. NPDC007189 TaxID=3154315 RepID=UPI0034518645
MDETVLATFAAFVAAVGVASVVEMRVIRNRLEARISACRDRTRNYVFPANNPLTARQVGKLVVAIYKDRIAVRGFQIATGFWYVGVISLLTCEIYTLNLLADGDLVGNLITAAISMGFFLLLIPPLLRNTYVAFRNHNFSKHREMKSLLKSNL